MQKSLNKYVTQINLFKELLKELDDLEENINNKFIKNKKQMSNTIKNNEDAKNYYNKIMENINTTDLFN